MEMNPKTGTKIKEIWYMPEDDLQQAADHNAAVLNTAMSLITVNTGKISDGYHTFDELYEHQIELYLKLAELIYWNTRHNSLHKDTVWCSLKHSDGSQMEGWFILGINQKAGEQITYHLPMKYWERACQHVVKPK